MKIETKRKLISLRYILPVALVIIALITAAIPSYRYIVGTEVNDAISLMGLIDNSWSQARGVLFGGGEEQTNAVIAFSNVLFFSIIALAIIFIIGVAAAIYSLYAAMKHFFSKDREAAERTRTLFITLIPNRIVLCVLHAMIMPICVLPYIMSALYSKYFAMSVKLVLVAPDALICAGALTVGLLIFSAIMSSWEKEIKLDLFAKPQRAKADSAQEDEEYADEYTDTHEAVNNLTKEENDFILSLLKKDNKEDK